LGADLQTARTGILFAGMLKINDAAYCYAAAWYRLCSISKPPIAPVGGKDGAYSAVLTFLPTGLQAAVGGSVNSRNCCFAGGKVISISHHFIH